MARRVDPIKLYYIFAFMASLLLLTAKLFSPDYREMDWLVVVAPVVGPVAACVVVAVVAASVVCAVAAVMWLVFFLLFMVSPRVRAAYKASRASRAYAAVADEEFEE